METYLYIGAAVCAVIAVVLVIVAIKRGQTLNEVASTQTTPAGQASEGQRVELKGVAKCESPLDAPYTKTPCVYYTYSLKQRERKRSGDRERYRWRTIDSGSSSVPFWLVDNSGAIAVRPDGATFETRTFADQYVRPGDSGAIDKMEDGMLKQIAGAAAAIGGMAIRQKVHVAGVAVNEPVYVLGEVRSDGQGNKWVVESEEPLLISSRSEEELLRSYGRQRLGMFLGAALMVAAAIGLVLYAGME